MRYSTVCHCSFWHYRQVVCNNLSCFCHSYRVLSLKSDTFSLSSSSTRMFCGLRLW
uniref:Uncharacterized protein n=1 Tax=Zea mays TaxID=4577 RepID=B6TVZ6_MAIZE|nr:hypothetical protein [Zea mays]